MESLRLHLEDYLRKNLKPLVDEWQKKNGTKMHSGFRDLLETWMSEKLKSINSFKVSFVSLTQEDAIEISIKTVLDGLVKPSEFIQWTPYLELSVYKKEKPSDWKTDLLEFEFEKILMNPKWRDCITFPMKQQGLGCRKRELILLTDSELENRFPLPIKGEYKDELTIPSLCKTVIDKTKLIIGKDVFELPEHDFVWFSIAPCGVIMVTCSKYTLTGGTDDTILTLSYKDDKFIPYVMTDDEELEAIQKMDRYKSGEYIDFRDHNNILSLLTGSFGSKVVCGDVIVFQTDEILLSALGCPQKWTAEYVYGKILMSYNKCELN
jgi:hypothetical protein